MSILKCSVAVLAALFLAQPSAHAQAPDSISFEGFLTDDVGDPIDATGLGMTFTLYKNSSSIWSEQQSVDVEAGVFSVYLGAATPLDTVSFDEPIELGIKIDSEASEMSPRTPLAAAPYARALPGFYTYYREDGSNSGYNVIGGASNNGVGSGVIGATIAGGGGTAESESAPNQVLGNFGTVGGGHGNRSSGFGSTVPGGEGNEARGRSSFAAGYHARARHNGSFVWNDRSSTSGNDSLLSTAANQFIVRAVNGFGINQAPDNLGVHLKQQGYTRDYGIRIQDGDNDFWEVWVDPANDYNWAFDNSLRAWIESNGGAYNWVDQPDALDSVEPFRDVLSGVLQIQPTSGRQRGRTASQRRQLRISTEQIESFFPEVVSEKDGVKGVSQKGLTIVTIKAIQELHEIVERQQQEIETLKNRLNGGGQ
jgi:hypothetical protein